MEISTWKKCSLTFGSSTFTSAAVEDSSVSPSFVSDVVAAVVDFDLGAMETFLNGAAASTSSTMAKTKRAVNIQKKKNNKHVFLNKEVINQS